jgi:hypothetical protein
VGQSDGDFVIGETVEFESRIYGETRTVTIHKPRFYDETEFRYPVLYLLDGRANFHHVTGLTEFLGFAQRIPGLLVVGVENANRDRELTTPRSEPDYQYPNGGADQFLQFLNEELVPWIDDEYRTLPYRILHGHSLAGFFVVHALLSEQQPFDAFIAISPSLQYDDQHAVRHAEEFLNGGNSLDATLYMAVGNDGDMLLSGMRRLAALFDEDAPEQLRWTFDRMDSETHTSVVNRATYSGLEFIFRDWHLPDALAAYDRFGIEAIDRFYDRSGDKLGIERQTPELILIEEVVFPLVEANRWNEAVAIVFRDAETYQPSQGVVEILADEYSPASDDPNTEAEFVRLVRATFEDGQADEILGYFKPYSGRE